MSIADKLSYLNDTKEGLRIAINQLGGRLTKTTPFRNYADGLNYLYSKIPKVEAEGENITFNDVASALMKLDLKGNTSQSGTPTPSTPVAVNVVSGDNDVVVCGKNLFNPITKIGDTNISLVNATLVMNGDEFELTATGTDMYFGQVRPAGQAYDIVRGVLIDVSNTSYIRFTLTNTLFTNIHITAYDSDKISLGYTSFNTSSGTYTIPNNAKYISFRFGIGNATIGTTYKTKVQIEYGNTSTPYEPYQSQTYPIYLGVENLFDLPSEETTTGITYSINDDKTINLSGTASANTSFILYKDLADSKIINGDTYTFFANKTLPSGVEIRLEAYNGTTWLRHILNSVLSSTTQKITASANTTSATRVRYHIYIASGTSVNISNLGLQLELGSKQNNFTPYGITPIELCKIGDYQDYFTKNSDGEWCKYNAIGKIVLDGSEDGWNNDFGANLYSNATIAAANPFITGYGLSNYYKYNPVQSGISANTVHGEFALQYGGAYNMFFKNTSISTTNDFKTWLSTHNTTVYFPNKTPYLSLIEDNNLIEQLDNLENAMSYEGTTNIGQVNNDKAFIISAKALTEIVFEGGE